MRGPSGFSVTGLGELGRVTNESRLKYEPIRIPGAWFACSVLEVDSEIGDGAFRDLGRGAMLYILRAGSMTGILTRTHGTGPDTSTVQFRPSCKCVINVCVWCMGLGSRITVGSRSDHSRITRFPKLRIKRCIFLIFSFVPLQCILA